MSEQPENSEILESNQNKSLVEVTQINLENSQTRFIPLELDVLNRVAASLPHIVPHVVTAASQASHWLVKFSPDVAKGLASRELEMMKALDANTTKQKWNRHRKALDSLYTANRNFTDRLTAQLPNSKQFSFGGVFDDLTAKATRQQHIPTGDRARDELEKYNSQFEEKIQLLRSSLDTAHKRLENPIQLLIERDSTGKMIPIGILEG